MFYSTLRSCNINVSINSKDQVERENCISQVRASEHPKILRLILQYLEQKEVNKTGLLKSGVGGGGQD